MTKNDIFLDSKLVHLYLKDTRSDLPRKELSEREWKEGCILERESKKHRITPLFASMLVPQVVEGEGSGQPSEPQPPSLTAPPSQSSGPPKKVGVEAVYTKEDDRVVRAATTTSSFEAEQESDAHTRFETASKKSPDPPLSKGNTFGSRKDSMEHPVDLTDFSSCLGKLKKTAQDLVIQKLKKRVKRLEKALRARTPRMKLFKIGTSRRKGLDKENVSKQGRKSDKTKPMFNDSDFDVLDDAMENVKGGSTAEQITTAGDTLNTASINVSAAGPSHVSTAGPSNVSAAGPSTSTAGDIFKDEMTTIADTLVAIRSARPRTTSVMIRNVEEEPRRATPVPTVQSQDKGKGKMVEPEPTPKNPRKAQIQMDEELAQRLFEEEQAQFEKEQRIAREKAAEQEAKDAALIKQMEDVQARMDADELLAERLQQEEREQFTVDEQARMLVDLIAERNKFFVMVKDSGKEDGDSQKQAESKREELRACLDIVPRDDITMDFESLASKYPIIDWKTHILTENMMYYQIIRANRNSKNYKIFSGMLDDFDRQDVIDLYRLVKERYETTSPEGYDLLLWGDLKNLLEPSEEDEIWKNLQNNNLISWRLFDSCGVHVLLMDTGIAIYIMVENTYPLT
ncbi:hypothetical protein Tco_0730380 [Tanacetum coccineum]|uniref:Uncharacterized protein n=1 Tax=Tanacetum coccineum TaxID=301880 RepID=A0ABQ4YRM6_9ASTR